MAPSAESRGAAIAGSQLVPLLALLLAYSILADHATVVVAQGIDPFPPMPSPSTNSSGNNTNTSSSNGTYAVYYTDCLNNCPTPLSSTCQYNITVSNNMSCVPANDGSGFNLVRVRGQSVLHLHQPGIVCMQYMLLTWGWEPVPHGLVQPRIADGDVPHGMHQRQLHLLPEGDQLLSRGVHPAAAQRQRILCSLAGAAMQRHSH
jgi:hypothetical protein